METVEDYIYYLDITLRRAFESHEDFIARAKREGLGKYVKR